MLPLLLCVCSYSPDATPRDDAFPRSRLERPVELKAADVQQHDNTRDKARLSLALLKHTDTDVQNSRVSRSRMSVCSGEDVARQEGNAFNLALTPASSSFFVVG